MFAVGIITFTLVLNFLFGMGIFGTIPIDGMDVSGNQSDIVGNFTRTPEGQSTGFGGVWTLVFGIGSILAAVGAVGIAIATQNATFVGVYIFSVYFWASWINAISILGFGGFIPASFLLLFTIPIGFVFVGAIVGMLSGV